MKFKTLFAILLLSQTAYATDTPRPIFASSIYNGAGILYVPTSTPLANRACVLDNDSTLASSATTATELGFLHGVTSNVQAQINAVTSGAVTSVFGRTGAITAQVGDYSSLYLQRTSNLSDIVSAASARTNLGLGSAATQAISAFDPAGAAAAAQAAAEAASDSLGSAFNAQVAAEAASDPIGSAASALNAAQLSSLQRVNNLSDLNNASSARSNLGLGSAATQASSAFDASGAAAAVLASSLQKANNLSDIANASSARTNLGLGSAATQPSSAFDTSGAAAAAQAAAIAASDTSGAAAAVLASSLQKSANLSDVSSAPVARTNLGLGSAATQATSAFDATGSAAAVLASSLQKASNLSDVASASVSRTNLGLGSAATHPASDFQTALSFTNSVANTAGSISLANDSSSPGNSKYYGTNSSGVRGFFTVPSAGSGTVTSVSIASANGFSGSVANSTTTPALTLTTSISGMIKGVANALASAVSGTDYAPGTSGLATGILKSTTSTGVLSIAAAPDFPILNQNTSGNAATATALASTPSQCTSGQFSTGIGASGAANCSVPPTGARTTNAVSTTFTVPTLTRDYLLNVTTTAGQVVVTLPSSTLSNGYCVDVKNMGAPATSVLVVPPTGTIDGASSDLISGDLDSTHYCAISSNWSIY